MSTITRGDVELSVAPKERRVLHARVVMVYAAGTTKLLAPTAIANATQVMNLYIMDCHCGGSMPIKVGFLAVYLAAMGALVLLSMPLLEPYSATLMTFFVLPLGLIGIGMVVYEKLRAVGGGS